MSLCGDHSGYVCSSSSIKCVELPGRTWLRRRINASIADEVAFFHSICNTARSPLHPPLAAFAICSVSSLTTFETPGMHECCCWRKIRLTRRFQSPHAFLRTATMAKLESLSNEVLLMLRPSVDNVLSLVSLNRRFHDLWISQLYKDVELNCRQSRGTERLILFMRTVTEKPHLSSYVLDLTLKSWTVGLS